MRASVSPPLRQPWTAATGLGLGGVALALVVIGPWLASLNGQPITQSAVGFSLPFFTFALVGTVLTWKRPDHVIGWLLLGGSLSLLLYGAAEEYARYGLLTAPGSVPAAAAVSSLRTPLWVPGAATVLVYLPLLFPTGRVPTSRWRPVAWIAAAVSGALVLVQWTASWPYRGTALLDPAEAWIDTSALAQLVELVFPLLLLCAIAAVTSLVGRFRRAEDLERMQIKWVLYSVGIFLAAILGDMATRGEGWLSPFWTVVLIPVSVGVAVLRYRLYEIDRIISRTVTYAVVLAVLIGIYAGSVLGLSAAARGVTGESGDVVVAVSTLAVAAAFQPVRRRVQSMVDRRFNRRRHDAEGEIAGFGRSLRHELDLEAIGGTLRRITDDVMAPSSVGLVLFGRRP